MDYLGDDKEINVLEMCKKEGKKVLLFWYPKDFTYVCPTELFAFQETVEEFGKRNCMVLGASCDTNEVHFAWLSTPKEEGGIEGVEYPILSDTWRKLAGELNITDVEDNVSYRATYLLDEQGVCFHESVNDMPIGRNVNEYLRILDAKIFNEKNGEVCPANWEEGKRAMAESREGVINYSQGK
jgi:peroxiredoxin (alkyl hydroperoxide reductase subunit C)